MGDDRTLGFPRQLKDTIDDDLEIQTFEEFKLVRSDTFRGALTVDSKFDRDRAEWRVPQSKLVQYLLWVSFNTLMLSQSARGSPL